MRRAPAVLLALASWLPAGCGRAPDRATDPLAAAREADARGDTATVLREVTAAEALADDRGRVATTWRLQIALSEGDVPAAVERLRRLVERFDGRGTDPRGRTFPSPLLAERIVRAAAEAARDAVEGPAPDLSRARRALGAGREALALGAGDDDEGREALERAGTWVGLAEGPAGPPLARAGVPDGPVPRIVVVADPFEMGEPVLPSVMRRWGRSLPTVLAGRPTGEVRVGIRRVEATPAQERAAMARAAEAAGARFVGVLEPGACAALGLPDAGAVVIVVGGDGRVAGRVTGRSLDPRSLDDLVARLAGR